MMKLLPLIFIVTPFLVANQTRLTLHPDWICSTGCGYKHVDPADNRFYLSLSNKTRENFVYWRLDYPFVPGQVYEMTVDVRAEKNALITSVVIGSDFFTKDIKCGQDWRQYTVQFIVPNTFEPHYLRLGLWQSTGTIHFSNIVIHRLLPIKPVSVALGAGEHIEKNRYWALYNFANLNSNYSSCISEFDAQFNTNRWDFTDDAYTVYRHDVSHFNVGHIDARIDLNINYYLAGRLIVEASYDRVTWRRLAVCEKVGRIEAAVRDELFPSPVIYIRLRGAGANARIQVNEYHFSSHLSDDLVTSVGDEVFVKSADMDADLVVDSLHLSGGAATLHLRSTAPAGKKMNVVVIQNAEKTQSEKVRLQPDVSTPVKIEMPSDGGAQQSIRIFQSGRSQPSVVIDGLEKSYIERENYGSLLNTDEYASFWWTDGVRKIGKYRLPPAGSTSKKIELSCARNEFEPVQFVVSPKRDGVMTITAGELRHKNGHKLTSAISMYSVGYVDVKIPSDDLGTPGPWPDPLPPLGESIELFAGENQPVWILVKIPLDAHAGIYQTWIETSIGDEKNRFEIMVHVWDFTLPTQTHLQTAFGFSSSLIPLYHNFNESDRWNDILDKYFQHFAEHRISPYDPFVLSPIKVAFDSVNLKADLDFRDFDKTYHRYIDEFGFNSFRLRVENFSSGTFSTSQKGRIGSYEFGSAEYEKMMTSYLQQLETHLRELDALDKAYLYWFDEPEPEDYAFVREVMQFVKQAAPGLTRLITEQPQEELFGVVDVWCPKTPQFRKDLAKERRALGEKVWWYICSTPKTPFATLFIDHYAVELRTWIWQSWKYNIDGILIWSANYWTSRNAFPDPNYQNPYVDPMSYKSGPAIGAGEISYWGNGDGRFLYPPKYVFESKDKNFDGPVSSIRWEMLREGLEDYEYLWVLKSHITRLEKSGKHSRLLAKAKKLLIVPESITASLTEFSTTPEPILEHRRKVAEMIMKLEKLNSQ